MKLFPFKSIYYFLVLLLLFNITYRSEIISFKLIIKLTRSIILINKGIKNRMIRIFEIPYRIYAIVVQLKAFSVNFKTFMFSIRLFYFFITKII